MISMKHMPSEFEMSIINGIKDVQTSNIEFSNISFRCNSITDADGSEFVNVTRCKDCRHYDSHCTDDGVCFLPDGDGDFARWEVEPYGFCAWAERKEVGA